MLESTGYINTDSDDLGDVGEQKAVVVNYASAELVDGSRSIAQHQSMISAD